MIKKNLTPFYVINYDVNRHEFVKYDVMPYLVQCYREAKKEKKQPPTFEEFKAFVEKESHYMYWARCQYEIVLQSWPCGDDEKKIDVHYQLMMNLNIVARILMENVGIK